MSHRSALRIAPATLAVLLAALAPARAAPIVEQLGDDTRIDYSQGRIFVVAQATPSLYLPSAKVARSEAEQKARRTAARRLRQALANLPRERLGCRDPETLPAVDQATAQAPAEQIDWGSDGSVRLRLAVPIAALTGRAPRVAAVDTAAAAVVVHDPAAQPVLFSPGPCATAPPAPPLFETLADVVATLPQARSARIVAAGTPAAAAMVLAIIKRKPDPDGHRSRP